MSRANYWKYYRDFYVPCGGLSVSPKCVRLMDWEMFISLAYEPLRINYEVMHKRLKIDESVKLYDHVLETLMKQSEEQMGNKEFGIVIMAQMFSIAYRLPVEPMARKKDGKIEIVFRINENDDDLITSDNYEEIREMIMEQNLIFDPIVAPNKKSQDAIDKAIEKKRSMNSTTEINIEAVPSAAASVSRSSNSCSRRADGLQLSQRCEDDADSMACLLGGIRAPPHREAGRRSVSDQPR